MKNNIDEKVIKVTEYYIKEKSTVRQTAEKFNMSKSNVYVYLSEKLKCIDEKLYKQAQELLIKNKEERHMRGGMATKKKYAKKHVKK